MADSSPEYKNSTRIISEGELFERETAETFNRILLNVYILLSLICIIVSLLIIFVILKHKRLREEKWSMIVLNWTILNCLLMITGPITLGIAVHLTHLVKYDIYWFVHQMEYILFFIDLLLIIILTIHWYMKLYHTEKYIILNENIKYVFIFVYLLLTILTILNLCFIGNRWIIITADIIMFTSCLVFILFMTVVNIVHAVKMRRLVDYSNRKNIPFLLSNALFASYLLVLVAILLSSYVSILIDQILVSVSFLIANLNPFYFFIILYRSDRNYNTYFKHIFTCRWREYKDELVEYPVSYNNGIENTC